MSETTKRILSGLTLGAIALAALLVPAFNWIAFVLFVLLFSYLGLVEFYRLTDRGLDGRPFRRIGFFFALWIILTYYARFLDSKQSQGYELSAPEFFNGFIAWLYPGVDPVPTILMLFLIAVAAAQLFTRPLDGAVYSMVVTVGGVLYTVVTLCHGVLLYGMPKGLFWLVLFLVLPIASDSGAYFAGKWFGRHNAGLKVSPHKTYEGYAGGIVFTVLVGVGFLWGANRWGRGELTGVNMSLIEMGFLSLLIAFLSIAGDLIESAIKRDAKTKDSASTIPGHGGVMDLADAMYFSLPAGFSYLLIRSMLGLTY